MTIITHTLKSRSNTNHIKWTLYYYSFYLETLFQLNIQWEKVNKQKEKKKTDPGKRSSLLELQKHVGFKFSNYFQKLMKHVNSYIFASLINIILNIVNSDKTVLIANND